MSVVKAQLCAGIWKKKRGKLNTSKAWSRKDKGRNVENVSTNDGVEDISLLELGEEHCIRVLLGATRIVDVGGSEQWLLIKLGAETVVVV